MSDKMEKINRFACKELKEEDVYCFSVILCDNEIDRDNEKFSVEALKKLAELYIGKTGIFNHDPKGENQTARIYDAEVVSDKSRRTADGEDYTYLKASAYMVRTASNEDLIREIEGGIKKEVSVGCAVSRHSCSVCGADRLNGGCAHKKGRVYAGKKCYHILSDPTDAYEWSFVAVPAQRGAGVIKKFGEAEEKYCAASSGIFDELCDDLRRDILRLSFLEGDSIPVEITKAAILRMEPEELLRLKRALALKTPKAEPSEIEKAVSKQKDEADGNRSFRI